MPKHDVALKIAHEIPIAGKDVEFAVKMDGKAFGRIRISRGTIDWYPRHAQRGGFALKWADFDAMMKEKGQSKA